METVNMHDAKTHFSKYVKQVESGEEITISRAGKPVAKLVPIARETAPKTKKRKLGFGKGLWKVPDDIKSPFKDDIEEMFGLKQ